MRVITLLLLLTLSAWAEDLQIDEGKLTETAKVVFTGTVTNIRHLPATLTNGGTIYDRGLWSADVLVQKVTKQDAPLAGSVTVLYWQQPIPPGADAFTGRICPGYPVVETNMQATFWCARTDLEGFTNALFIPAGPPRIKKR